MVSKNLAGVWPKQNWAHLCYLLKNKVEESFAKVIATICVTPWLYNYKVLLFFFNKLILKIMNKLENLSSKAPFIPYHRTWSHR